MWGIVTTVLCCLPLGIPSIINATKVNALWAQGDAAGALAASAKAKKFALWAAIAGAVGAVVYVTLLLASDGFYY